LNPSSWKPVRCGAVRLQIIAGRSTEFSESHGPARHGGTCRWRKRGTEDQALGRSRGDFTTKIHARTNAEGLPIGFEITSSQAHDATAYESLMDEGERPKALMADRVYDSDAIVDVSRIHGTEPVIPSKSNRIEQRTRDTALYALRNRIKRFFNKLKNARRVATRYDKTTDSFLGFVQIASIKIWLRFDNRT
jgi:transposase